MRRERIRVAHLNELSGWRVIPDSLPEFQIVRESGLEREWRAAMQALGPVKLGAWGTLKVLGITFGSLAGGGLVFSLAMARLPRGWAEVVGFGGAGIAIAALVVLVFVVMRRTSTYLARLAMHAVGLPVCLRCGYDLRGQAEPRCPECGVRVELPLPRAGEEKKP